MEWNDEHLDRTIGSLLRAGVILAASVVFIGGVWELARYGSAVPNYRSFRGAPAELRSVAGVLSSVVSGKPGGLIQLGLLLLIATPIARVGFSVFAFAAQRDRLYVILTLVVLAILCGSLFGLTGAPH